MPKLKNAKYEAFAQLAAKGDAASKAYQAVYKCKDSVAETNGPRLLRNAQVATRVSEIQEEGLEDAKQRISFDAVSQFTRLEESIVKAEQAGQFGPALKARVEVLEMFGYKDHPTLTHEHVLNAKVSMAPTPGGDDGDDIPEDNRADNVSSFKEAAARVRSRA